MTDRFFFERQNRRSMTAIMTICLIGCSANESLYDKTSTMPFVPGNPG